MAVRLYSSSTLRSTLPRQARRCFSADIIAREVEEFNSELASYFGSSNSPRLKDNTFPNPQRITVAEIPGHVVKKTSVRRKKKRYDDYPKKATPAGSVPSILVIHGPLSFFRGMLVDSTDDDTSNTKDEIFELVEDSAAEFGLRARNFYSNSYGEVLDEISSAEYSALVLNPGASTHDCLLLKALDLIKVPSVLVSTSNQTLITSSEMSQKVPVVKGFGPSSYKIALMAVSTMLDR